MNNVVFKPLKLILLGLAAMLALVACSNSSSPGSSGWASNEVDYVASVTIDSSMTQAELESTYGGSTIVFKPEAGFAVLGFNQSQAQLTTLSTSVNQDALSAPIVTASGVSVWSGGFSSWAGGWASWAGGFSSWAGGFSSWASGFSSWASGWSAWSGGLPELPAESQANLAQIEVQAAQVAAKNLGYNVKVAFIDTGIDLKHPMFEGRLAAENEWKDYIDNDNYPQESNSGGGKGHGTSVAGLILQIAPMTTLLPIRVLDEDGMGDTDDIILAIDWAVQKGANVINISLGTDTYVPALETMVNYAASQGVYIVASVGNEGASSPAYPAAWATSSPYAKYILGVGSVDKNNNASTFSNLGAEFYAPGESIVSSFTGDQTANVSGTSFAAPQVAGALALALGDSSQANKGNLEAVLEQSAKPIGRGKGLIDVLGFMTNLPDYEAREALFVVGSTSLNNGDTAVKERLEHLGFKVRVVDDSASQTSDADNATVVLIAASVSSSSVKDKFRDISRPVIVYEAYLYDDMKMTGDNNGSDFDSISDAQRLSITTDHSLAAGLTGSFDAYTRTEGINWGKPANSALVVGTMNTGSSDRATIFAYEKNSQMVGMTAPARRLAFFLGSSTAHKMTEEGWKLFDAAVVWAAANGSGNHDAGSESSTNSATLSVRISQTSDDAEEASSDGEMSMSSSDLELGFDGSSMQIVGLRFQNISIPKGATITRAYIEFETDETDSIFSSVIIQAEASNNAATFSSSDYNISNRAKTSADVKWTNISAWNQVSEKQQTPDLSSVVQEVVNRGGWSTGNSMAFIITGYGERTAESYNGERDNAPLLHIEYSY